MNEKMNQWVRSFIQSFSYTGLVIAVIFFSISLSPSLLPRPYILQGILSGFTLTLGYALGFISKYLWIYLQLPKLTGKFFQYCKYSISFLSLLLFIYSIYAFNSWQNEVRSLMNLPSVHDFVHFKMTIIAIAVSFTLFFIVWILKSILNKLRSDLNTLIPQRVANVLGVMLLAFTIFTFTNNFIISKVITTFDDIYSFADENADKDTIKPTNRLATGSQSSLISWESIGRTGQNFVTSGPKRDDLNDFFAKPAQQPIRVYVGLRSSESAQQRAELALQELIRVNGFNRRKLIIATPTGTGWLDPSAMDTLEYIHRGDTAIVAMQYSYLPSWLTLLVDPTAAKQSALVLYNTIHRHWSSLPKSSRPELYVFGLSLGALGAETSINLTTIINNPIQGGLFAGPPFPSTIAPILSKQRNKGSPQWLPTIQDSSLVRYTNQKNQLSNTEAEWGPMRFVYIQYASDPMVFFSLDLFRKEPDWMKGERGHDVSPNFKWYPVITFLQVLFDLPMADRVPRGNSHNYSASSYLDGWLEVTQPSNLSFDEIEKIQKYFFNK